MSAKESRHEGKEAVDGGFFSGRPLPHSGGDGACGTRDTHAGGGRQECVLHHA